MKEPSEKEREELEMIVSDVEEHRTSIATAYDKLETYLKRNIDIQPQYIEINRILRERLGFGGW